MKINSENCEAWFLDYYEGNLSKEGVEEMFAFLALNPDLRDVFDSYDEVSFSPDKQIHFDWKSELKKPVVSDEGINESNYEEYFVSHVEGLLNADGKSEVEKFLLKFPSKREELELLQRTILLPEEHIVFEHKDALRKSVLISQENFDELAISSVEGLLNNEEEKALSASLAGNEEQQKLYALYKQTKLTADTTIVFEDKESLKRKERGAFWWMLDTHFAAAAAIALLIGIFYWNYSGNGKVEASHNEVASADTGKTKPVIPSTNSNNPVVNSSDPNNIQKVNVENGVREKQVSNTAFVSANPHDDKQKQDRDLLAMPAPKENRMLSANVADQQVNFSDAYSYTGYIAPQPLAANQSISPRQAVMRWAKKKLDRTPVKGADEDEPYLAAQPSGANGNVNGFDLTSSAISALGNATGSNLRLGHEAQGTVLTVGKYELLLSRN
jgi:hypothetical protein